MVDKKAYTYPDGTTYDGQWDGNNRHGFGVCVRPDGTRYEGEWKSNKRHGLGVWIRPDGTKYEGEWANSKPNGQGTFTFPSGNKRSGYWRDGKYVGQQENENDFATSLGKTEESPLFNKPIRSVRPVRKKSKLRWAAVPVLLLILVVFIIAISSDEGPPEPLPRSGVMTTNYSRTNAVAPFKFVSGRGSDNYYIKVYHYGSERLAATAFLRAGEETRFDVPLGSYELRWATGKDWYGPSKRFGRNTDYYKSYDLFRFTESNGYIKNWIVEFRLIKDGNLERISIDEEAF